MRKSYGNTWWGQQWLHALHNIDYSNRLPRGKSYANAGAVKDIRIEENRITAKVQGRQPRPYRVEISLPAFAANEKAKIIEMVTANPVLLSKLLNRELPNELYESCLQQRIHIFPRSWNDMKGSCSCPDWAVPCKHMAATLYLVANEIDKNPFLAFELHDFDLFKGLEGVGYTAAGQKGVQFLSAEEIMQAVENDDETIPFEWNKALFGDLDFSTIPYCQDQLTGLLPEKPLFYPEGDFRATLKKVYDPVARTTGKMPDGEWDPALERVERLDIILNEETDFLLFRGGDIKGKVIVEFSDPGSLADWLKKAPVSRIEQLSEPMRGLVLAFRLSEKLAERGAFVPQLLELEVGRYKIRWLPAYANQEVWDVADLVEILTPSRLLFYKKGRKFFEPTEEDAFPALVSVFLNHFVQTGHGLDHASRNQPIMRLFFYGSPERFEAFETREYPSAIHLWLSRFFLSEKTFVPVIQVEDLDGQFQIKVAVEDKTRFLEPPVPLALLFRDDRYKKMRLDVLRDLTLLSDYFPQISLLVASQGKEELVFDPRQFTDILLRILPTIQLFGIRILLPKALRRLLRPQLSMQLEGQGTVKGTSLINLESMLRFKWQIALGDQVLSPEEFLQQVKRLSGIVRLNDQYVFIDEREVQALVRKMEHPPALGGHQLLQAALTEEYQGAKIKLDGKAQKLLDDLLKGESAKLPDGLLATLRPYQLRGYEWLYKNARLGFGSLIADDMGLGKTVQVIAALQKLKEDGTFKKQKGLVIVPTTLLTNWDKEIRRFAPGLKVHIYHGPGRKMAPLDDAELLLTTYGVVRSEAASLQKRKWQTVIIDEAQNIKNPATAQTKAVKAIEAPVRIAMSGTPVENRLSEYWSIFDFTNRGYLGNLNHFKDEFARPIEIDRDQHQLSRFRRATAPFILRRVKTDKSIIDDLPDKVEQDQYCQLTAEQAAIYQNVIDNTMSAIEDSEGIERRGLVLKLITALKQVCNHPKHFLKTGESDPALSGKAQLLLDLLRQVLDGEEKAILFTQYQEMGKLLVEMLEKEFGFEAPFLHGGVSRKNRDEMVDDFQRNRSTRVMLLSLKAGGTGLNLTAASNVIHYDLWWNPAVEAQATDRAFRIGQHSNVLVHRFITQGTFEEKINKLLQNKKELANLTVTSGEKWIGELSNRELKELVELSS